ncbi:hypothetical protein AB835_10140 [Candidatus Endobugula sertula]|uniref:CUB domain-containing protein n=1 Tax=Candidatus Endobugula sertula TaxID=62101 RepID=A0A1D2QNP8_9GAMM|nr:hypothetical protein AB835_10140 [Candidatus Endobugula sertula]
MKMWIYYGVLLLLSMMTHLVWAEDICTSSSSSGVLTDLRVGRYSQYCSFLIRPGGQGDITLSFSNFNYSSGIDTLYVYDGTSNLGVYLGAFSGPSLPNDLVATSGSVYILSNSYFPSFPSSFTLSWSQAEVSVAPVAEWHFDESVWSGVAGEVQDSIGSLHGLSINGATTIGSGKICRAGFFDGIDDYLNVSGIDNYLNTTASLSFWLKTSQSGNNMPGITGIEEHNGDDDILWGWLDANGQMGVVKGGGSSAQSYTQINDW